MILLLTPFTEEADGAGDDERRAAAEEEEEARLLDKEMTEEGRALRDDEGLGRIDEECRTEDDLDGLDSHRPNPFWQLSGAQ